MSQPQINFSSKSSPIPSSATSDTLFSTFNLSHIYEPSDFVLCDSKNYDRRFHTGNYDNFQRINLEKYKNAPPTENQNGTENTVKTLTDVYQVLLDRQFFMSRVGTGAFRVRANNKCKSPLSNLENFCQLEFERCIRVDSSDSSTEYAEISYDFGNFDVMPLNDTGVNLDTCTEWMCVMTQREAMRIRVQNTHHTDPIALFVTLNGHSFIQSTDQSHVVIQPNAHLCLDGIMKDENMHRLHQLVTCPVTEDEDMILNIEVWPLKRKDFAAFKLNPIVVGQAALDTSESLPSLRIDEAYIQSKEMYESVEILRLADLMDALSQVDTCGSLDLVPQKTFVHVKLDKSEGTHSLKIALPNQLTQSSSDIVYEPHLSTVIDAICSEFSLNKQDYILTVNNEPVSHDSLDGIAPGSVIRLMQAPKKQDEEAYIPLGKKLGHFRATPHVKKKQKERAQDKLRFFDQMRFRSVRSSPVVKKRQQSTRTSLGASDTTSASSPSYNMLDDFLPVEAEMERTLNASIPQARSARSIRPPVPSRRMAAPRTLNRKEDAQLTMGMMSTDLSHPSKRDTFPEFGQHQHPRSLYGAALRVTNHPLTSGRDTHHLQEEWDRSRKWSFSILLKNTSQWKKTKREMPKNVIPLGLYPAIGLTVPSVLAREKGIEEGGA